MSIFAAIQMSSGGQVVANLEEAEKLIAEAVRQGAKFVVLPENFAILGKEEGDKLAVAEEPGKGRIQQFLSDQARRHGVWICGGTIPMTSDEAQRVYSASLVFDSEGNQVARYDKIHMFDVELRESGERYTESDTVKPGESVITFDSPFGRCGIAICYDLRFPELFREMATQGVEIILVPSSFTEMTGRAHWETLLRARAIENLSYVVASAQGGYHLNGRSTHGHSMIVDPWGGVVSVLKTKTPGVVAGEIKQDFVLSTRKSFPALQHRRL